MPLTNTITTLIAWACVGFWALGLGHFAQRLLGYTPASAVTSFLLGLIGLFGGNWLFPTFLDYWWVNTSYSLGLPAGLLGATLLTALRRAIEWWIDSGSERWDAARALGQRQAAARRNAQEQEGR